MKLRLYPKVLGPHQVVDEAVGAADLAGLHRFAFRAGFIGDQRRGRGFQAQIKKGLEFLQGAGAVPAADQERPDLGVIKEIPEQFPQTIAIKSTKDRDGRGGWIKVNPGLAETLHDIVNFGPEGEHSDSAGRIDNSQFILEVKGDEVHHNNLRKLYLTF